MWTGVSIIMLLAGICAILGDNVYFDDLSETIRAFTGGGHLFLKDVADPQRFGVAEIETTNGKHRIVSIEEKPAHPKSPYAATGCYVYDNRCFEIIRNLKPSARGEFEITDVSRWYMEQNELFADLLNDEWIDAGTFDSLFRASEAVRERKLAQDAAVGSKVEEVMKARIVAGR